MIVLELFSLPKQSIVYTIMKHTGSKFFSRQLPGYTLLIPYFIQACETILLNEDLGLVSSMVY